MGDDDDASTSKSTKTDLEFCKKRRTNLYRQFTKEYNASQEFMGKSTVTPDDLVVLEARLEMLQEHASKYHQINETIIDLLLQQEEVDEKSMDEIAQRESDDKIKLNRVKRFIETSLSKNTASKPRMTTSHDEASAKLPKLNLPTFDGNLTKWTAFWEMMEHDVLNGKFSDITKFNYIMGQLRGKALESVQGIYASGSNLDSLTKILKERFGQKRKIVRTHVNHLLEATPPSYTYASLMSFYNEINGDLRSLEHLDVPIHA